MSPPEIIDAADIVGAANFAERVVAPCRPVVLRGACRDWPVAAQSGADLLDALLRFDSGRPAEAYVGTAGLAGRYHYGEGLEGFNFQRESLPVAQAFARIAANATGTTGETLYVGSLPVEGYFPGFAQENPMPWLAGASPRIWIGNGSTVACHYDAYDNLACCLAGERRFTLFPPQAIGDLYVGPIDHTLAGQPISLAVGSAPGDPRYPRFEAVRDRAIVVELSPGDALYLPKLWWHQVEATSPINCLVNYWWDAFAAGPDAPMTTMMLAMIAIAERPEAERKAWRAWFDHYVFRPDGHPLAHLPPEKHGVLGPLSVGNYGRIRAMVMQFLRGR